MVAPFEVEDSRAGRIIRVWALEWGFKDEFDRSRFAGGVRHINVRRASKRC